MARLLRPADEVVHDGQRLVDQPVQRRVRMGHGKELQAERIPVSAAAAADVLARDQPLQHAVNLVGAARHVFDDLRPRQPLGLGRQQFQDVQAFVERRRPVHHLSAGLGGGLAGTTSGLLGAFGRHVQMALESTK